MTQQFFQRLHFFLCRRPACGETDDGVCVVAFLPEAEGNPAAKALHVFVFQIQKDLIRGGFKCCFVSCFAKCVLDPSRLFDCPFSDLKVEAVPEQFIKLDTENAAFCEKSAALFDDREEVRKGCRIGDHDRLTEERAAFCAADVEDVAQSGEIG